MKLCINCDHPDLCHEGPERGLSGPVRGFICHRLVDNSKQCICTKYTESPVGNPQPRMITSADLSIGSQSFDINEFMKRMMGGAQSPTDIVGGLFGQTEEARKQDNKLKRDWDNRLTD